MVLQQQTNQHNVKVEFSATETKKQEPVLQFQQRQFI